VWTLKRSTYSDTVRPFFGSHLKRLELAPSAFGSLCIPDSVEVVSGGIGKRRDQYRLLQFGRESSLREIDFKELRDFSHMHQNGGSGNNAFVRLSEDVLRSFRGKFECLWPNTPM
jgi:hypothetical protein